MRRDGRTVILTMSGELDMATAPRVHEHAAAALGAGADPLVAEVGELTFVDSSGLEALILTQERAREGGVRFCILNGSAALERVLDASGTREIFQLVRSLSEI